MRLIIIFSLSFLLAFAIIKVRSIYLKKKITSQIALKTNDVAVFPDLPVPEGAKSVFSKDKEKRKKGYIYQCSQSVSELTDFYRRNLTAQKWQEDENSAKQLQQATGMTCLAFSRNSFMCYVEFEKLRKNTGTAVVIQVLRKIE